jgi:hypothetical protein
MKYPSSMGWTIVALAALAAVSAAAGAGSQPPPEVYVSTGEHGEISFSDVAAPGAERVYVATSEPAEDPLAELERRIEQTLTVANALEASRLAREKARADANAGAAAAQSQAAPEVVYQDRYVDYPYVLRSPYDGRFHRDGRGRHHRDDKHPDGRGDRLPQEPSRSRQFPYDPD